MKTRRLLVPAIARGATRRRHRQATLYKPGMAAFALSSIAIGLVSSIASILLLHFAQGVLSAATQATGQAIIGDAVPAEAKRAPRAPIGGSSTSCAQRRSWRRARRRRWRSTSRSPRYCANCAA